MNYIKRSSICFLSIVTVISILSCSSDMSVIFMQDIPYKTVSCFERELKLIKQDDNIFSIDKDITYGGIKYKKEKKTMLTPSGFKLYVFYTWKSKDTKQFLNKKKFTIC